LLGLRFEKKFENTSIQTSQRWFQNSLLACTSSFTAPYNYSEPWDGPNNRLLWAEIPDVFKPTVRAGNGECAGTQVYAIVGQTFVWSGEEGSSGDRDGSTIQVVTASHVSDCWMRPDYLILDEERNAFRYAMFDTEHKLLVVDASQPEISPRYVGLIDGRVFRLKKTVQPMDLKPLLTIDSDEGPDIYVLMER
jgi:hypothetical protein